MDVLRSNGNASIHELNREDTAETVASLSQILNLGSSDSSPSRARFRRCTTPCPKVSGHRSIAATAYPAEPTFGRAPTE